jgi:Tol biopolymer transport system component
MALVKRFLTKGFPIGMILPVTRGRAFFAVLCMLGCERAELLGSVSGPVAQGGSAGMGGNGEGGGDIDPVGPLVDPDARDTDPTFTADRLELYFMSTRQSSKDIYKSVRSDPTAEWGAPVPVTALASGYQEENPRISADGLRMWFFTDRDRSLGTIWEVTRNATTDDWGPLVAVPGLSVGSGSSNVSAGMDASATYAVVSGRPTGAPGYDLYEFTRSSTDEAFGEPTPITEVNSASDDFDPYLTPNGLAVAFASNRLGNFDLFLARRTSRDVPFEAPVRLDLNSSAYEESSPNFTPDLAYLMYASDQTGSSEIYEAILFPEP